MHEGASCGSAQAIVLCANSGLFRPIYDYGYGICLVSFLHPRRLPHNYLVL
jgi:hypothetical protein